MEVGGGGGWPSWASHLKAEFSPAGGRRRSQRNQKHENDSMHITVFGDGGEHVPRDVVASRS